MTRGDKYSRRGNQLPKLEIREVFPAVLPCPLGLTVPSFKVRDWPGGTQQTQLIFSLFLSCSFPTPGPTGEAVRKVLAVRGLVLIF